VRVRQPGILAKPVERPLRRVPAVDPVQVREDPLELTVRLGTVRPVIPEGQQFDQQLSGHDAGNYLTP